MQTMPEQYSFSYVESKPRAWYLKDRAAVLNLLWHRVIRPMYGEALKLQFREADIVEIAAVNTWREYNEAKDRELLKFLASGDGLMEEAERLGAIVFLRK